MLYYFFAGVLIGAVVAVILSRIRTHGTVVVYFPEDTNEPPCLGFKINKNTNDIYAHRRVLFKVEIENLNSQK